MLRQANRYYNGDQFQVGCDVSELDRDERRLCVRILEMHQSYSRLLLKTGAHSSTSLLGVLNDAKEKVIFCSRTPCLLLNTEGEQHCRWNLN